MRSKRRLKQLKSARATTVLFSKKWKVEATLFLHAAQLEIADDKLSTTDTSDTKAESGTWFWNESPNESDSDTEEGVDKGEEGKDNESNPEIEESRVERAVSPEIEIRWNKEGENKLRGAYGNGSMSMLRRVRKSALDLEKQA